jgi:hypothetical protein
MRPQRTPSDHGTTPRSFGVGRPVRTHRPALGCRAGGRHTTGATPPHLPPPRRAARERPLPAEKWRNRVQGIVHKEERVRTAVAIGGAVAR